MTREQAIERALAFEDVYLDFPFEEDIPVLKHRANNKWFGVFLAHKGELLLNLKCDPALAPLLRENVPGVIPGYHMNKTHWNSVVLSQAPDDEVLRMLEHSYALTKPKKRGGRG